MIDTKKLISPIINWMANYVLILYKKTYKIYSLYMNIYAEINISVSQILENFFLSLPRILPKYFSGKNFIRWKRYRDIRICNVRYYYYMIIPR